MPTHSVKASEIERAWHVVDAEGMVLGRLATEVARILRGKHKPTFTPHLDVGDHVIVINASKIVLTSDKASKKLIWRPRRLCGSMPLIVRRTASVGLLASAVP